MKFSLLTEYNVRNIFILKNLAENEKGRLVPDHFLFLRKKQSSQHLDFNVFWQTLTWMYNSKDMLNFDFV